MVIKAKYERGVFRPLERVKGIETGEIIGLSLSTIKKAGKDVKSKFFGIWKNRKDIKSGLDYVRKIRQWNRTQNG